MYGGEERNFFQTPPPTNVFELSKDTPTNALLIGFVGGACTI